MKLSQLSWEPMGNQWVAHLKGGVTIYLLSGSDSRPAVLVTYMSSTRYVKSNDSWEELDEVFEIDWPEIEKSISEYRPTNPPWVIPEQTCWNTEEEAALCCYDGKCVACGCN